MGYIGIIGVVYIGILGFQIGIMEKKTEATIISRGLGFRA